MYKGVLIDQSVEKPLSILEYCRPASFKTMRLEGENSRGELTFYNISVSEKNLWKVLNDVAKSIKSPGWFFHLVGKDCLYFVMPNIILMASNKQKEIQKIKNYALSQGIHPKQLDLASLFDNPHV